MGAMPIAIRRMAGMVARANSYTCKVEALVVNGYKGQEIPGGPGG